MAIHARPSEREVQQPSGTPVPAVPMHGIGIAVEGLVMDYPGGHRALRGVDLEIPAGQVVALVGANGSGKSTLLRCMVHLIRPSAGRIRVGGTDTTTARRAELRRARTEVGFVFQRFHLVSRLSAFANVLQGAAGRRGSRCAWPVTAPRDVRSEAMHLLARVGLSDAAGRRVDRLSGGQQQRVAIARMLLQHPKVILADEPVASLDPAAGAGVMDLLREIATERGLTAVIALHQLDLATTYAERIVGLREGGVALDRPTSRCEGHDLADLYRLVST